MCPNPKPYVWQGTQARPEGSPVAVWRSHHPPVAVLGRSALETRPPASGLSRCSGGLNRGPLACVGHWRPEGGKFSRPLIARRTTSKANSLTHAAHDGSVNAPSASVGRRDIIKKMKREEIEILTRVWRNVIGVAEASPLISRMPTSRPPTD